MHKGNLCLVRVGTAVTERENVAALYDAEMSSGRRGVLWVEREREGVALLYDGKLDRGRRAVLCVSHITAPPPRAKMALGVKTTPQPTGAPGGRGLCGLR
jgi:hypothetical protein